jgi:hypothetical protein
VGRLGGEGGAALTLRTAQGTRASRATATPEAESTPRTASDRRPPHIR